jgi:hypothetical protein
MFRVYISVIDINDIHAYIALIVIITGSLLHVYGVYILTSMYLRHKMRKISTKEIIFG